jgi:hypothetical protein
MENSQPGGSFKIRGIAHTMQVNIVNILLGYLQEVSQTCGNFKISGIAHTMQVSILLGYLQAVSQPGGSFKIRGIAHTMQVSIPRLFTGDKPTTKRKLLYYVFNLYLQGEW